MESRPVKSRIHNISIWIECSTPLEIEFNGVMPTEEQKSKNQPVAMNMLSICIEIP